MLYELNKFQPQPRLIRTSSSERPTKVTMAPFNIRERVIRNSSIAADPGSETAPDLGGSFVLEVEAACEKVWEVQRQEILANLMLIAEKNDEKYRRRNQMYSREKEDDVEFQNTAETSGREEDDFMSRRRRAGLSQEAIRRLSSSVTEASSVPEIFTAEGSGDYRYMTSGTDELMTDDSSHGDSAEQLKFLLTVPNRNGSNGCEKIRSRLSSTTLSMGGLDFSSLLLDEDGSESDGTYELKHTQSFKQRGSDSDYDDLRSCVTTKPAVQKRAVEKHGGVPTPRMRDVWKGWAKKLNSGESGNQRMPSVLQSELQFRAEMEQKLAASALRFKEASRNQPGCFTIVPARGKVVASLEEGERPLFLGKWNPKAFIGKVSKKVSVGDGFSGKF